MTRLTKLRVGFATFLTLSSLLIATAPPAAATTVLVSCTGTCGVWHVHDSSTRQDAVCVYYTAQPQALDKIKIKPPTMYGPYSTASKVGWRFKIQKFYPVGTPQTIYTSSYQTATASTSSPAYGGHGFSTATWTANNPDGSAFYRAVVQMQWWHGTSVVGYVKIRYDRYKQVYSDGSGATVSSIPGCFGQLGS